MWPAVELVRASLSRYSITGLRKGDAGLDNFRNVLANDSLATVLTNTVVWVVAVVVLTILISLGVAQFLTKEFWGRRHRPLGGDRARGRRRSSSPPGCSA